MLNLPNERNYRLKDEITAAEEVAEKQVFIVIITVRFTFCLRIIKMNSGDGFAKGGFLR